MEALGRLLGGSSEALGAPWGPLGASWKSSWSSGRLWMRYFGDLGGSRQDLGASWDTLGGSREGHGAVLGASWEVLGSILEVLESCF